MAPTPPTAAELNKIDGGTRGTHAARTVWSVALTVSGCLVAGYNDLTFDPVGYAMALMSCVLQAAYLIAVQQTGVEQGLCSQDLLKYNAMLSIPPLLVVVILDGELAPAVGKLSAGAAQVDFTLLLIASLTAGMLLNYSIFLCTKSNSALTTTGARARACCPPHTTHCRGAVGSMEGKHGASEGRTASLLGMSRCY
jgi:hypothetical protein